MCSTCTTAAAYSPRTWNTWLCFPHFEYDFSVRHSRRVYFMDISSKFLFEYWRTKTVRGREGGNRAAMPMSANQIISSRSIYDFVIGKLYFAPLCRRRWIQHWRLNAYYRNRCESQLFCFFCFGFYWNFIHRRIENSRIDSDEARNALVCKYTSTYKLYTYIVAEERFNCRDLLRVRNFKELPAPLNQFYGAAIGNAIIVICANIL